MAVRVVPLTMAMVPTVAEVHRRSFGSRLGPTYAKALVGWFLHSKGAVSIVAVDDLDRPMGYALGATDGYRVRMNAALRRPVIRALVTRPWVLFDPYILGMIRGHIRRSFERGVKAPSPRRAGSARICLVAIGVSASARGHGVGGILLRAFETEAARGGFTAMTLAVRANNSAARRLYEQAGWTASGDRGSNPKRMVTYQKSAPLQHAVPGKHAGTHE